MATGIKSWSTTASSNDSADSSINWLEDQAPSTVNNSARAMMAAIRTQYQQTEWRDWGHTVTYASATTFTIAADVTSIYTAGRAIHCSDATELYGYVKSSSYSSPNTTVTVTLDSGSLSASLSYVELGPEVTNPSIPYGAIKWIKGADIASANDLVLPADGNYNDITGTTTINGVTSGNPGEVRKFHFDGALTLKHNTAPSAGYDKLFLLGAADITTAANDEAEFVSDGTYWRMTNYSAAAIDPTVDYAGALANTGAPNIIGLDPISSVVSAGGETYLTFSSGIDSTYDSYLLVGVNIRPGTDNTYLRAQLSSGASFWTGTDYNSTSSEFSLGGSTLTTAGAISATYLTLNHTTSWGNNYAAYEGGRFEFKLWEPASTSIYQTATWMANHFDTGTAPRLSRGGGWINSVAGLGGSAFDGVRFFWSSGTWHSGTIYLYGLRK